MNDKALDNTLTYHPWLHRYAWLLVIATFLLIITGGNVTSRDAGLSVPDGFTVYGYFLWAFPKDQWVGNIFHEHIHRLKGSVIGMMTIVMAIWLYIAAYQRRGLRQFGLWLLLAVLVQGVLGGLRVEFANILRPWATPFAVIHAVVGQLFLCMTVVVLAATSKWWIDRVNALPATGKVETARPALPRWPVMLLLAALVIQLALGAATRLRENDQRLAIPDFPASYGQVLPPISQDQLQAAIINYYDYDNAPSTLPTLSQVWVHFAHRAWALVVAGVLIYVVSRLAQAAKGQRLVLRPAAWMVGLVMLQIILGATVIWTGRRLPDLATAHQALGAGILAVAAMLALRVHVLGLTCRPTFTSANRKSKAVSRGENSRMTLEGA